MTRYVPGLADQRTFGASVPPLLDLVGRELGDDVDAAVVQAARELPSAVALWRAWRLEPELDPVRVYVLECTDSVIMSGLAGQPVRVYTSDEKPGEDTRAARNAGALLWTAAQAAPIRIARVFDAVDAQGGHFAPDHELLSGNDLEQVAHYLEAGAPVLATAATLSDVVDRSRGAVVPMSYRTDGSWLWTESVAYYLRAHALAPEPELLAHIRAAGRALPTPDAAAEHRALALLFQSAAFIAA